jgi:hypothetical protein
MGNYDELSYASNFAPAASKQVFSPTIENANLLGQPSIPTPDNPTSSNGLPQTDSKFINNIYFDRNINSPINSEKINEAIKAKELEQLPKYQDLKDLNLGPEQNFYNSEDIKRNTFSSETARETTANRNASNDMNQANADARQQERQMESKYKDDQEKILKKEQQSQLQQQKNPQDTASGQDTSSQPTYSGGLLNIGMPIRYRNEIDPKDFLSTYYSKKMNVIEIIPANFSFSADDAKNILSGAESDISKLMPLIYYDDAIKEYQNKCKHYGVIDNYYGIKLYITDDTQASDTISNSWTQNIFEQKINQLSQATRQISGLIRSFGDQANQFRDDAIKFVGEKTKNVAEWATGLFSGDTNTQKNIGNIAGSLAGSAAKIALEGQQIAFPKIWNSSMYSPNLSATIKLFSPYGHPKAIKQFIIRPLIHLIALGAPKTDDGILYSNPPFLTIRARGLSYMALGGMRSITIRRGGSDTSFNIYRQPLTVDVTIDFECLIDGFGVVTGKDEKATLDKDIYKNSDKYAKTTKPQNITAFMPVLGDIVRSLMPYEYDETTDEGRGGEDRRNPSRVSQSINDYYNKITNGETPQQTPQGQNATKSVTPPADSKGNTGIGNDLKDLPPQQQQEITVLRETIGSPPVVTNINGFYGD